MAHATASLREHSQTNHENFVQVMDANPSLSSASEIIYRSLETLLSQCIEIDSNDPQFSTIAFMGMGALTALTDAIVLTASGKLDTGLGASRRAMEFACYAAKIKLTKKPEQLAMDWVSSYADAEARTRFNRAATPPLPYRDEKYRLVWPIIVNYGLASDAGVHANLASLAHKWEGRIGDELMVRNQASGPETVLSLLHMVLCSHQIYEVFGEILTPRIVDNKTHETMRALADAELRRVRMDYATLQHGGRIPPEIVRQIVENDKVPFEDRFKRIVEEWEASRAPKQPATTPAS